MKVLYAGPMGYRRGDLVEVDFDHLDLGPWTLTRMQRDACGRHPTLYDVENPQGIKVREVHKSQIKGHAGILIEIGRDGRPFETAREWAARHRQL